MRNLFPPHIAFLGQNKLRNPNNVPASSSGSSIRMKDFYQPQPPTLLMKLSPRICRRQRASSDNLSFSTPIHRGWKWKAIRLFGLMFFLLGNVVVHAQTSMSEYQVKALFLCNFVKYVDWPAGGSGPITIGIMG